ncbi:unnamed protein product, partial [Lymnaea stagnalis]
VALTSLTSAQVPVSNLCSTVLCPFGTFCRVVQACPGPVCPPRPSCVRCIPRGSDAVCNRNNFVRALLVGNPADSDSLQERKCNPFFPGDCPFNSVCAQDGSGRGTCCYGRPPPGLPATNRDTVCIVNRCQPFCPPGTSCQRVTICPFVPPCFEELQCRPFYSPLPLAATVIVSND